MISVWWLPLVFSAGVIFGVFLFCVITANGDDEDDEK